MNMNTLAAQALEQAMGITGKGMHDKETQTIAFKLACAIAAQVTAEGKKRLALGTKTI